jgi:integrase
MARKVDRLNARTASTLGAGFHADGGGLYLRVETGGARRWVFVFRFHGKRCEMGFGALADISLAAARELARHARALVKSHTNPIDERRRQRAAVASIPFGEYADRLIISLAPQWRSPIGRRQWETTLRVDARSLRPKQLSNITTEDVLAVLKPIWLEKPETARRLRGRIERVLDAAKAEGLREGENPARWKGHLALLLPRRPQLTKGHHPALPYARASSFMRDLRSSNSISAQALEFTILTNARTTEARLACGREIDLEHKVWTVPGDRMKSGKIHRVPLSAPALSIVRRRIDLVGEGYLFPGLVRGNALSNMAMSKMLKLLGHGEFTVHGFRSTFRDWAADRTTFPREVIEAAMAHVQGDDAEQAYWRSDVFDRRRRLMDAWAAYCEPSAGQSNVARIA